MSDYAGIRGHLYVEACPCCERVNRRQEPDLDDRCECSPCESCKELVRDGEECENDECPSNCEHDDIEDGHCLTCGADRSEWQAAAAYDYVKGMKYD